MEGKTYVLDPAFLLLAQSEIPSVGTVKDIDISLIEGVEPVVIEILHTCPLQLHIEQPFIVRLLLDLPHWHLVREGEPVTRESLLYGHAESRLALALMVCICRVEISKTSFHEDIDHSLEMVDVYGFRVSRIQKRKPHEAKA